MLIALGAILLRGRRDPVLPRAPENIAAVALSVCGSRMVGGFEGLAVVDGKTRDRRVREMGRRYWGGEMLGVDGVVRWGVDYDERGRSDSDEVRCR